MSTALNWKGVMPAMTTAFDTNLNVDLAFVARHAAWLIENGCTGIICLGSLGEAATLRLDEKIAVLKTVVATLNGKVPVVAAISALSTADAVALAQAAHAAGCSGLMILPPYVYKGDWRENKAHVAAILKATPLPRVGLSRTERDPGRSPISVEGMPRCISSTLKGISGRRQILRMCPPKNPTPTSRMGTLGTLPQPDRCPF